MQVFITVEEVSDGGATGRACDDNNPHSLQLSRLGHTGGGSCILWQWPTGRYACFSGCFDMKRKVTTITCITVMMIQSIWQRSAIGQLQFQLRWNLPSRQTGGGSHILWQWSTGCYAFFSGFFVMCIVEWVTTITWYMQHIQSIGQRSAMGQLVVTIIIDSLAMKSGCVKSREPPSLRLCSRRQEEPASSRLPSSSSWPRYLPSGWMSRTAWQWPACGHGYLSASCAPPSPASEARGGIDSEIDNPAQGGGQDRSVHGTSHEWRRPWTRAVLPRLRVQDCRSHMPNVSLAWHLPEKEELETIVAVSIWADTKNMRKVGGSSC